MNKIAAEQGIESDLINLISNGTTLIKEELIKEQIEDDSTVYLSFKLLGGGKKRKKKVYTTKKKTKHHHKKD